MAALDQRDALWPDLLPLHRPAGVQDFTAALARTAMGWHRPELSEQDTVRAITDSVAVLLPQVTAAAVLDRIGSGQLHVTASSGRPAGVVAALHRDSGDQPWPHTAEHLRSAPRGGAVREQDGWPVTSTTAGGGERGSLVCAPMGRGKTMFGTLLIAIPTAAGEQLERRLVAVAIHGSTAVAAARDRDQLRAAVDTRDIIGQAKGILMQRLHLTADAAFDQLARTSTSTNIKLRDVCSYLCSTGELPHHATRRKATRPDGRNSR